MATINPSQVDEALSVVRAQSPKRIKGFTSEIKRKRIGLAVLDRNGRILTNQDGHSRTWSVRCSEPEVVADKNPTNITYSDRNYMRDLTIEHRGYRATDALSKRDALMNRGPEQIFSLYDKKRVFLMESMRNKLAGELYVDGNAAGNTQRFQGLQTFCKYKSGTVATDRIARPDGSYAGQSIELGAAGGSASADLATPPNGTLANDFPYGTYPPEYDYLSPLICNSTSSRWNAAQTTTWEQNCEDILSFVAITQRRRGAWDAATLTGMQEPDDAELMAGRKGLQPLVLMASDMKTSFDAHFRTRNRQLVQLPEYVDLGFPSVMNFEGMGIDDDFECPAGEAYLIAPEQFELVLLTDDLFAMDGPMYQEDQLQYLYLAYTWGNFRFRPKAFARIKPIA